MDYEKELFNRLGKLFDQQDEITKELGALRSDFKHHLEFVKADQQQIHDNKDDIEKLQIFEIKAKTSLGVIKWAVGFLAMIMTILSGILLFSKLVVRATQ